jgi:hypothetical protein
MTRSLFGTMIFGLCLTAVTADKAHAQALADSWPPPQINSSLYPCPVPYVPREVGSTIITNQALAPHEMLYAHKYRAIYPPYYYKKCLFPCMPFVPKPCIRGTVVKVKYSTKLPCCFTLPWQATQTCFSNTQFH